VEILGKHFRELRLLVLPSVCVCVCVCEREREREKERERERERERAETTGRLSLCVCTHTPCVLSLGCLSKAAHLQSAQHGAGHDERRATPLRAKALYQRVCCPRGLLLPLVGERRVVHTLGQPNGCGLAGRKALVAHAALNLELNEVVGALT